MVRMEICRAEMVVMADVRQWNVTWYLTEGVGTDTACLGAGSSESSLWAVRTIHGLQPYLRTSLAGSRGEDTSQGVDLRVVGDGCQVVVLMHKPDFVLNLKRTGQSRAGRMLAPYNSGSKRSAAARLFAAAFAGWGSRNDDSQRVPWTRSIINNHMRGTAVALRKPGCVRVHRRDAQPKRQSCNVTNVCGSVSRDWPSTVRCCTRAAR